MIKLFLVRHGEATEGWTSKDPPLSDLGKSQALSLAPFIDKIDLNKVDLVSSPLTCLLYTSPSPRDKRQSRMPSSA